MPASKQRNLGFSLVELMVALVAGLLVTTAVVAFALSSMKSNGEYVQSTRLTQELRGTMDLVTRELRRAGYDEYALKYMATGDASPFSRLLLANANADGSWSCVVYSYDRKDGVPGTRDTSNGEIRGMRWASRNVNGANVGVMEFAESSGANGVACDGDSPDYSKYPPACDADSNWCSLSDPRVLDITKFGIVDARTLVNGVQVRDLDVSMIGGVAGKADVSREIRSTIRVRSDCYDETTANCSTSPSP
jgi:type II secretory pathway pseudopilin PulG